MVKTYQTIKQLYELFDKYPEINLFGFHISEMGNFFGFTYHKDTKQIITISRCGYYEIRTSIEEFIIKLNCQIVDVPNLVNIYSEIIPRIHLNVTIVDGDFEDYYNAGMKILRYYKKFRYNLYRKRRDLLKRELMEYYYHPSKVNFEI